MLKIQRPITTSPDLDKLEHEWWNDHSEVIASVWEMDETFQKIIRNNYINDAKRFFSKSGKVNIFEPGCGSGWVGQMIANDNLGIIGTDFSKTQIYLSGQNAANKNLSSFCDYHELQSDEWPESAVKCDGILLHSFLHHLNAQEIDGFFDKIKASFAPGTKIWMFEPCFYAKLHEGNISIGPLRKFVEKISQKVVFFFNKNIEQKNMLDTQTFQKFKALEENAAKNNYYLSPKEIPFDVEEYRAYLSKYMNIEYEKWAIINLVGWSFFINLVKDKSYRKFLGHTVLRLLGFADRYLSADENYGRMRLIAPNHGFRIYAGILK